MHRAERPSPATRTGGLKRDARNRLLTDLVAACGMEPTDLTDEAARVAAIALADILRSCPVADRAEFDRRARCYCRKYPGAALTPRALCSHWAEFPPPKSDTRPNPYAAPIAWESKLSVIAEIEGLDLARLKEYASEGWLNVPIYIREMIVKLP